MKHTYQKQQPIKPAPVTITYLIHAGPDDPHAREIALSIAGFLNDKGYQAMVGSSAGVCKFSTALLKSKTPACMKVTRLAGPCVSTVTGNTKVRIIMRELSLEQKADYSSSQYYCNHSYCLSVSSFEEFLVWYHVVISGDAVSPP